MLLQHLPLRYRVAVFRLLLLYSFFWKGLDFFLVLIDGIDGIDGIEGIEGIDEIDAIEGIDEIGGIDGIDEINEIDEIDGIEISELIVDLHPTLYIRHPTFYIIHSPLRIRINPQGYPIKQPGRISLEVCHE